VTDEDRIRVGCFGVHWAPGGIAFLEQGGAGMSATGVDIASPFQVVPPKRGTICPHAINIGDGQLTREELDAFAPILKDPLVDALLPVPRKPDNRCFFFADPEHRLTSLIMMLSRMASPVRPVITPVWDRTFDIHSTNVAPLVVIEATPARTKLLHHLTGSVRSGVRTVVLTGHPDVVLNRDFERRSTGLVDAPIEQLREMPWERFGAHTLRRYMRGENLPLLCATIK
jgi:hypothetical protein